MELSEQIISKTEINSRAVQALLAIVSNGLVATKTDLAECLGAKPAKFSEILNFRMKVGIDMIAKICDSFDVDPYWLLMGRGKRIFNPDFIKEPYYIDDAEDPLDRVHRRREAEGTEVNTDPVEKQAELAQAQVALKERAAMADMFYAKTLEQAEEIGKLKAKIKDLERRLEKSAGGVSSATSANVG